MKNYTLSFLLLIAFALASTTFTSCGDSCDEEQAVTDAERILALAFEYADDITNEDKCKAYYDAVKDYIDDYKGCEGVEQSDVDDAEAILADLPCGSYVGMTLKNSGLSLGCGGLFYWKKLSYPIIYSKYGSAILLLVYLLNTHQICIAQTKKT